MNKVKKMKKKFSKKNKTIRYKKGAITDEVIRIRILITNLKKTARNNRKKSSSTTRRAKPS